MKICGVGGRTSVLVGSAINGLEIEIEIEPADRESLEIPHARSLAGADPTTLIHLVVIVSGSAN